MIVYDLKGIAHDKESVDARECIEFMGWSETPIKKVRKPRKKVDKQSVPELPVPEKDE